jgi:hypothetical protein
VAEFGSVLAIVATDADDFRRAYRRQQRCLCERDAVHAAAGKAFDVAIAILRRLEEQASDFVAARDRLDQAVVGGTIEFESAVFHQSII